MNKLFFKATTEQRAAIEGLAFWVANQKYIEERFGVDDPEIKRCRDTICLCLFPELDALGVPFWVQNSIICWSENWRNYKQYYLNEAMKAKNIIL